jgi:hypothetical protein
MSLEQNHQTNSPPEIDLLSAFRIHYRRFESAIADVLTTPTDSTVVARIGDDLDEFSALVTQVSQTN